MNMIYEEVMLTPRARRRIKKLDEILSTATAIALEGGLEAVTIHRLAKELDYTPGALYRYFPSKAALLAALHLRLIRRLSTRIHAAWSATKAYCDLQGASPNERHVFALMAVTIASLQFAAEEPGPFRIITASFGHPRHMLEPESAEDATEGYVALIQDIAIHAQALADSGFFRPGHAAHRAITVLMGSHSLLQLEKVTRLAPNLFRPQVLARELSDSLLRGWAAEAELIEPLLARFSDLENHLNF
jgi:AcrR family transcriptional regulator